MYCNFSVLSDSCLRLALEMQHLNSFQYTQAQNNLWYFAMLAFTGNNRNITSGTYKETSGWRSGMENSGNPKRE